MAKRFSPSDHKPLSIPTIRRILDDHCILTGVEHGICGCIKILALENAGTDSKLIDVTNWSKAELYDWLGY